MKMLFQSLIWVACPTGATPTTQAQVEFYGFNPSYGLHALRANHQNSVRRRRRSFNPSYGLHALRAASAVVVCPRLMFQSLIWVACPTGEGAAAPWLLLLVFQSLIWVACPTGADTLLTRQDVMGFQSLIWVACPTGQGELTIATEPEQFQSLIWVACPTG